MRLSHILSIASVSYLLSGCVAATDGESPWTEATSADSEALTTASGTFLVRRDMRKCVSPLCGGYWVEKVNGNGKTRCADGKLQSKCYVAEVDAGAVGVDLSVIEGDLLYVGKLKHAVYGQFGNLGKLVATQAWYPANPDAPSGTFYSVSDNGIRCFRAPCFNLDAVKVNSYSSIKLSGLTGDMAGKAGDVVFQGEPVIIAGTKSGSSSKGRDLLVTQFYREVAASSLTSCSADSDCVATQFHSPITSPDDCYCAMCPTTAGNAQVAASYAEAWGQHCLALTCPAVRCMAPLPVACVDNTCQFVETN